MDLVFLFVLIGLGLALQALFWGGLIALAVKLFKAGGGATGGPYPQIRLPNPGFDHQVGPYEPGPIESEIGFIAADAGIDLNR
jgi:hypothetical protein